MTRTVNDAALMLQALAGYDPGDPASQDVPVPDFSSELRKGVSSLRLRLLREFFADLEPEIRTRANEALVVLRGLTAQTTELSLALDPGNIMSTIQEAEAFASHADAIAEQPELYSPETLWRLRRGQNITPSAYLQARQKQDQVKRDLSQLFFEVDILVVPTVPIATPLIADLHPGEQGNLRQTELATLRNTRPFNLYGLPAVSVPCGFTDGGLPVGLQIAGPPWGEAVVLRLAHAYEQVTNWHKRRPASV
jgi:Asp-tRNA(Asn)/Glu-tRNA(Gln) amidotransferase A subunit family amidase